MEEEDSLNQQIESPDQPAQPHHDTTIGTERHDMNEDGYAGDEADLAQNQEDTNEMYSGGMPPG